MTGGREMQDNTGKKLRSLFDYQKFEREPGLGSVIEDTVGRSAGIRKLSDDELEFAAGGVNTDIAASQKKPEPNTDFSIGNAFCPTCGRTMKVRIYSGSRGYCTKCGTEIDNV